MRPRWRGTGPEPLEQKGSFAPGPNEGTNSIYRAASLMQASASAGESPAQLEGRVALARSSGKKTNRPVIPLNTLPERMGLERAGALSARDWLFGDSNPTVVVSPTTITPLPNKQQHRMVG